MDDSNTDQRTLKSFVIRAMAAFPSNDLPRLDVINEDRHMHLAPQNIRDDLIPAHLQTKYTGDEITSFVALAEFLARFTTQRTFSVQRTNDLFSLSAMDPSNSRVELLMTLVPVEH